MAVAAELTTYESLPGRVVFGPGSVGAVAGELIALGAERVMTIAEAWSQPVVDQVGAGLDGRHAEAFADVRQHVPAQLAATAVGRARESRADWLVAIGGGSSIGLAKAIARETGLPILAVPTTYAGSEMTPIWGLTTDDVKETGRDLVVLPKVVVYDPVLTLGFPAAASAASGMNAMAHCVEALWTPAGGPVSDALALEGITRLASGLRRVVADPGGLDGRTEALRGAWLGGAALGIAGTGLHHKICHVLGGRYNLPHAEVHAAVLPGVVEQYRDAVPDTLGRIARALGAADAVEGLHALARDLEAAITLRDLGLDDAGADVVADIVAAAAPTVPAPVTRDDVRAILARAMTRA